MYGAQAATYNRKCQQVPNLEHLKVKERADTHHQEAHDYVQRAYEQAAVNHVGDCARRNADEEERRHSQRKRHADHEGVVGEVKYQPAEGNLLAHVSDGVEEGRGHQHTQVAVAQGWRGTKPVPQKSRGVGARMGKPR